MMKGQFGSIAIAEQVGERKFEIMRRYFTLSHCICDSVGALIKSSNKVSFDNVAISSSYTAIISKTLESRYPCKGQSLIAFENLM